MVIIYYPLKPKGLRGKLEPKVSNLIIFLINYHKIRKKGIF